jgi:DNA-binding CsgD family transcriptional regulator
MDLIERADVLSQLQMEFEKTSSGEGHCVFINGEAGIGKTALVKAFCKQQQKGVIYQGSCDALFTPRPLAPLYDIVWQIKRDLWPTSHTLEERSELFLKVFHELSLHKESVLIVFEDIHWADEATLDFIKFFIRRLPQLRCLFILTYREDDSHSGHSLKNVLGGLSPDLFTRIQLNPLSRQAVYKLAEEKGYDPEPVFTISAGNPFYVTEILASYSPGVPENIKDSILSVYNQQEEGTKNAWQICSVIPEGLEISRFATLKSSWEGMDHCFALKIIVVKNERVIFKHELYRRTIEASLSPFKRITLNKKILDLFLQTFDEKDIERIVHYAKHANENKAVAQYAPIAARQAAAVGAHVEASKLFLTAIEYSEPDDTDRLLILYENYSYECYLINQIKEAIIYEGKALKLWQEKKEMEKAGNCMRFLSRLWWFDGNRAEAEKYGKQAIEVLESQPSSRAKAMALSNMSQLKMLCDESGECIRWGMMAIEMAREINNDEILCHAYNNVGSCQWKIDFANETGKNLLMESLQLALKNSFHEHAARAYSNIISVGLVAKDYDLCLAFLQDAINYCEERDLDASKNYKLYMKSQILLETGNTKEAAAIVDNLLSNPDQLGTVKLGTWVIRLNIQMRKGNDEMLPFILESKKLILKTQEHQRIIPLMIVLLQYEWLMGVNVLSDADLALSMALAQRIDIITLNSEFHFWLKKVRKMDLHLGKLYEPYQLLKEGKIHAAASFWEKKHCLYDQAMTLFEGDESDKKMALVIFQGLDAPAICEKIKMEMRAEGIKKIPRGQRESTKTNPMNLTNRELDVLQLLQKGIQNKEIANSLFISAKTVDNHISNILFKLDVNSRAKAVNEAIRLKILKQVV